MRVVETATGGAPLGESEEVEVTVARFVTAGLSQTAAQPGLEAKGSAAPAAALADDPDVLTARSTTRRS